MNEEKRGLIEALRASGAEAVTALRDAAPELFEMGVYENGWNGFQLLAHVASIEWTYANLVAIARDARAADVAAGASGDGDLPTRSMRGGNDAYNARQVEKRAGESVASLIEEFARNRERTIAAVSEADEALFDVSIRTAGGRTGRLGDVMREVAIGHVSGHVADLLGRAAAQHR